MKVIIKGLPRGELDMIDDPPTSWDEIWSIHCSSTIIQEKIGEGDEELFQILQNELGDNILVGAGSYPHPLNQHVRHPSPATYQLFVWLGNTLRDLRESKGYDSISTKLKNKNTFWEGISELKAAWIFSRGGYEIEFEPKRMDNSNRTPDLLVTDSNTNIKFYVEVTELGASTPEQEASETFNQIMNCLHRENGILLYSLVMHRSLSKQYIDELIIQINILIEKAKTGIIQELCNEDLSLYIGSSNQSESFKEYLRNKGIEFEIRGPPTVLSENSRIRNRIRTKNKQLPFDTPSILFIWSNEAFLFDNQIHECIFEVEQKVYDHEHLVSVVVCDEVSVNPRDQDFEYNGHRYMTRRIYPEGHQLLFFNRYSRFDDRVQLFDELVRVFSNCL